MPDTLSDVGAHDATDTAGETVRPTLGRKPKEGEEVWAMQVPGTVSLRVTTFNRFGQAVEGKMVIGPNRVGLEFRIKTEDREENQAICVHPDFDPFRNGSLVRVDTDQQTDPATASGDALSTEDLLDIYDLEKARFETRVRKLGEIPLRRLLEVGQSMDCSHRQISFVQELIAERYAKGGPQTTMDTGERLS